MDDAHIIRVIQATHDYFGHYVSWGDVGKPPSPAYPSDLDFQGIVFEGVPAFTMVRGMPAATAAITASATPAPFKNFVLSRIAHVPDSPSNPLMNPLMDPGVMTLDEIKHVICLFGPNTQFKTELDTKYAAICGGRGDAGRMLRPEILSLFFNVGMMSLVVPLRSAPLKLVTGVRDFANAVCDSTISTTLRANLSPGASLAALRAILIRLMAQYPARKRFVDGVFFAYHF